MLEPHKEKLRETYDRIAKDWHEDPDHQLADWWLQDVDAFIAELPPGAHILDVGCGGGIVSKYFVEKQFQVTGIDLSPNMIELAGRNVPGGHFFVRDLDTVEQLGETFDGLFMQTVLLHIPKESAGASVKHLESVLAPRGSFYIATKERSVDGPEEELKTENDYGYPYERYFSYYSMAELKSLLQNAGLSITYERTSPRKSTPIISAIGKKSA